MLPTWIVLTNLFIFRVDVWCAGGLAQDESPPTLFSRYEKKKVNYLRLLNKTVPLIMQKLCKENWIFMLFCILEIVKVSFYSIDQTKPADKSITKSISGDLERIYRLLPG
jgi:hypothetical protein